MILLISEIVLLLSGSVLCICLIIYLSRITRAIEDVRDELQQVTNQTRNILSTFQTITDTVLSIANEAKYQADKIKEMFEEVRSKVENILNIEQRIRSAFVDNPAKNLKDNLSAIRTGFSVFWNKLKR